MAYFTQQLINGLTLGAIYGLIAIGYTLVYGIIGMINFAHGEIYMIGAFIALITFLIVGPSGTARPRGRLTPRLNIPLSLGEDIVQLLQHRVGHLLLGAVERRDDRYLDIGLGVDRRDLDRITDPMEFENNLAVALPLIHIGPWPPPSRARRRSSPPPSASAR